MVTEHRAGDTFEAEWTTDYSSDEYSGYLVLVGPSTITLTATGSGQTFSFEADPSVTAAWPAGRYAWSFYVSSATERYTLATGTLQVLPDLTALAAGTDTRTHAERCLEAIEAQLEGRLPKGLEDVSIAGTNIRKIPIATLPKLRDYYRAEVLAERRAKIGRTAIHRVPITFVSP